MIPFIIDEIEKSIETECYLAALTLALTLPDICGKAEFPTEKSDTKRYIQWYNIYIGEDEKPSDPYGTDMPYASGEVIYNLRNSILHQGNPGLELAKIKEERCKVDSFQLIIAADYDTGLSCVHYGKDNQVKKRVLKINIVYLCKKICSAVKTYYENNKESFNFFNYTIEDKIMVYDEFYKMRISRDKYQLI